MPSIFIGPVPPWQVPFSTEGTNRIRICAAKPCQVQG